MGKGSEDVLEPPEYVLEPPEYVLEPPEYVLEPPEHVLEPPEHVLELPEYVLELPEYVLEPREYVLKDAFLVIFINNQFLPEELRGESNRFRYLLLYYLEEWEGKFGRREMLKR